MREHRIGAGTVRHVLAENMKIYYNRKFVNYVFTSIAIDPISLFALAIGARSDRDFNKWAFENADELYFNPDLIQFSDDDDISSNSTMQA